MSKAVDLTKPLSEEDVKWLQERSRQHDIDENKRILAEQSGEEQEAPPDVVFAPTPTVAAPPIEPGSPADNPPRFVGQRPYGVDRAVWGGSTGLTEQQAYGYTAAEPHTTVTEEGEKWRQNKLMNPESTAAASEPPTDEAAQAGEAEQVEEVEPKDLSVDELKDELRQRDLPVGGNKDELVKRLKKALKEEQ